jgi:RNA polymerase sigma-54 factor
MKFEHAANLEQNLKLSQSQLQSLKILSLDNCELNDFLQNEYVENPLMDYCEHGEFPAWNQYGSSPSTNGEMFYREIPNPAGNQIKDYLLEQLNSKDFSSIQWEVFGILIDCLDENGYFKLSVRDICRWLKIEPSLVQSCLNVLTTLEPCGIFAPNLPQCLLVQLEKSGQLTSNLRNIILYHLDDVASGRISSITKSLSMSTQEVRKCIAKIRTLNPRPLSGFSVESTNYVVPDIILNEQDGEWGIYLNDQWIGNYSISDCYLNMMKTVEDSELKDYFQQKYARCQFIINSIEQRRETILKISKAIFEWQHDFFTRRGTLVPMTLTDIANVIDMHPSTVSRGIKNKYLQYPAGIISLKKLFISSAGKGCMDSSFAIKKRIKGLVSSETPLYPHSDSALVNILKKEGIQISRRTVAKYREELGIQSTYFRRQLPD